MKLTSPDKSYTIFDKIKIQIYVQKSHMRREWLVIDLAERERKKNSDGTYKFKADLEEEEKRMKTDTNGRPNKKQKVNDKTNGEMQNFNVASSLY